MSGISFWFLAISYWIHLLATISWALGLGLWALLSLPALRDVPAGTEVEPNRWLTLQRRILPIVNASLVLLLITGFFQMTIDEQS